MCFGQTPSVNLASRQLLDCFLASTFLLSMTLLISRFLLQTPRAAQNVFDLALTLQHPIVRRAALECRRVNKYHH
jgi:hypothetical protein